MFVTGPNVVKTVTHEEVTMEDLGGADTHAEKSGVAHFSCDNEAQMLQNVRKLFSYLPLNNLDDPPFVECEDDTARKDMSLDTLIPKNPNKPYDMHTVINTVMDKKSFLEVHTNYARNIIVGLPVSGENPLVSLQINQHTLQVFWISIHH